MYSVQDIKRAIKYKDSIGDRVWHYGADGRVLFSFCYEHLTGLSALLSEPVTTDTLPKLKNQMRIELRK